jgi:NitT/TauT family transport system ATP-binding protein
VKEVIGVDLPFPRDQIATKELAEFTHLRGHVARLIKREQVDEEGATEPILAEAGQGEGG